MNIELLPLDRNDWAGVAADPDGFASLRGLTLGIGRELLREVAEQTLGLQDRTGAIAPPWSGFLAVDRDQNIIVGTCGFKAPVDAEGMVEIAYFTFPDFEGRGVASKMATGLVECARADVSVRRIVAHTLPEQNASTRVLTKTGFVHMGAILDPEDGLVWRWELSRI